MEGEILNPVHVKNPSEEQNTATAVGQSAQPTPVLSQSTKPTLAAPIALDVLESAKPTSLADAALGSPESTKPTLESAEPTLSVPGASEVSSDDFATTVFALVSMEIPSVPYEEMVDYEATLE
ncbi:unnamed protein product [Miscanthus lutarioriparius]|uniref:Uncharacterized protein n=1 Tax=Miscanthus lutarioriparius TaxID=422564 RepID=A0A811RI50_9POAL|nr:unnamed protein product [Miscanthus lutarioriparius]